MSIPATPEQQHQLLVLQQLDSEIGRLRRRAADLPEQHEADRTAEELREVASRMTGLLDALQAPPVAAARSDDPVRGVMGAQESSAEAQRLQSRLADVRARGEHLAARHREALAAVPVAAAAIAAALAETRARRDALAAQTDEPLLAAYDTARRRLHDPAVVPVSAKGTCGGCHLTIPAMQLDRIRIAAATALPRCPECERYLVVT